MSITPRSSGRPRCCSRPRLTAAPSWLTWPTPMWGPSAASAASVRFRLATRGSALALIQAQLAADALAHRYPEHEFVLAPLTTHGDQHSSLRLTESAREGIFVKELEQAVLDGRAELAVHSAK